MRTTTTGFWEKSLAVLSSAAWTVLALAPLAMIAPATAQELPDNAFDNSGIITLDQGFFAFEVEGPIGSLKEVPIWDEIEPMLDDPYAFALEPNVEGNAQGWRSYRSTQPRRRSFIFRDADGNPCAPGSSGCSEVGLIRHLVHPLNYNYMTGEEMRLLNIEFEGDLPDGGTEWIVPDDLDLQPDGSYEWEYETVIISPGELRIEDDEAAIDFNSPIAADDFSICIITTDAHGDSDVATVPEGSTVCGGDPGEPGYAGFGLLLDEGGDPGLDDQYSVPAVPGLSGPDDVINPAVHRLFDPARGFIEARSPATGAGGLRKPSLRIPEVGGTPSAPNYAVNTNPADVAPSNENDYVRNRADAIALGKAFFWDMQVGSDSVQACGSCHFAAGADNRTRNQLNPNDKGGDIGATDALEIFPDQNNNQDVTAGDFPFHRLADVNSAGERASDGDGIVDHNPGNVVSHSNDVMSSMGVHFGRFRDIPTPGGGLSSAAFVQNGQAVRPLTPDLRSLSAADNQEPIPLFEGLRRVEPRNTPTLFAAAMNFDNFWDGRARHDFNGGSVFGATDPQAHVWISNAARAPLIRTRQIIRFVSLASLATGPALSEFEMSFLGRNWAKLGKKLLQNGVVPLANQLVDPTDSAMGQYSNQNGSACAGVQAAGLGSGAPLGIDVPGLCISYRGLIQRAFFPALWQNAAQHLNGCYTDGRPDIHTPQCPTTGPAATPIPIFSNGTLNETNTADPFDGYRLTPAAGLAIASNTNQFTQMEANMALFFGLSIHKWGNMLIPDDSPMDRFFDENNDAHATFGESGEPGVAIDLRNCFGEGGTGGVQPCFTPVGNFQRDPGVIARFGVTVEGAGCDPTTGCQLIPSGGTRPQSADTPDPLLGLDFFLGSNLSLKNPNFRSLRCGECHAAGNLTDHTFETSHQVSFGDRIQEFITGQPGIELFPEALGRGRIITGFALEGELGENAQDAVERNVADFALDTAGFPKGQALFDNGVYNIGVTPIENDLMRGGDDPFGWPLSLTVLALKSLGGLDYSPGGDDPTNNFAQVAPGNPLPTFDPRAEEECQDPALTPFELASMAECNTGGLFEETAQDQEINPGFGEEPANPLLPDYLWPWASNINVGDESNIDEVFIGLNTLMEEPMLEGFADAFGPFNPAAILGEMFNSADRWQMATWPNMNRVNRVGGVKAPPLRHVERTGPYFHNGGKLTLRQVLDFYLRGGDFPITNSAHRDFLIMNLNIEDEALGGLDEATGEPEFTEAEKEAIRVALVDFLLELTDERVDFQRAPFDQPEIFVPLDGTAPENGSLAGAVIGGRPGFLNNLANGMFRHVPATGAGGAATATPNFLGIVSGPRLIGAAAFCGDAADNHYCH